MTKAQAKAIRAAYAAMDDDELGNEIWTLRNERQYLNCWSDDEVGQRLAWLEVEATRRSLGSYR